MKSLAILYTRPSTSNVQHILNITFENGRVKELKFIDQRKNTSGMIEDVPEVAEVYQEVLDGRSVAENSVTEEQLNEIFAR